MLNSLVTVFKAKVDPLNTGILNYWNMLLSCIQAFWIRVSVRKIVDVQYGHMSGRGTCLF